VVLGEKLIGQYFKCHYCRVKELRENDEEDNAVYVGEREGMGYVLCWGRLTRWILGELEDGKWVCACPFLANA
jgi:hypothetical protein